MTPEGRSPGAESLGAESPAAWYERISAAIVSDGHRPSGWEEWSSWPFTGALAVRDLEPPAAVEPARRGSGGVDCHACADGHEPAEVPGAVWWDEEWLLVAPLQGTALPFAAFLLPRRHADLAGLTPSEAARMGELLVAVEQAVLATLPVPRIQALRWGDGGEHLHWWLLGRPTGALQLRGTFLSHWDDVLPLAPPEITTANLASVARALAAIVGGSTR